MATTSLSTTKREAILKRDAYRCQVCDDPAALVSSHYHVTICQPCQDIITELGGPVTLADIFDAKTDDAAYSWRAGRAAPALTDNTRVTIVTMRQRRLAAADMRIYPAVCAGCRNKFRPNRKGCSNFFCAVCTPKHLGAEFRSDAPGYVCATVAQQLAQPAKTLTGITGCLEARTRLGLEPKTMTKLLGEYHPNGRAGKPYSRSHLWRVEHGERPPSDEMLLCYAGLINAVISLRTRGRMSAEVKFSARRWRVTLFALCTCGRKFKANSLEATRCPHCRSR